MNRATFPFYCSSAFCGILLLLSGNAYPQGWADITPPGLSHIEHFQKVASEGDEYEIYAWSDVGFRFSATSQPMEFVSHWIECCDCGPFPYGEVSLSLGSVVKVSDDPPSLLSIFSTPGCEFLLPHARLYLDSTVSAQTIINLFGLYGDYCPAVLAVKPYLPTSVYVHAADSLYHSNDGGLSFQGISRVCDSLSVSACPDFLMFHPQIDGLGFAGGRVRSCEEGYLFRTTDNGVSWDPILDVSIRSLLFDPLSPDVVYAAGDSGIYKSWDSGQTWASIYEGEFGSIEVGVPDPDALFAGSLSGDLWASTNAGAQWSLYNNTFTNESIIGLHKDPRSDTLIACATDGVFKIYGSFVVTVEPEAESIPDEFRLYQNYPNPFNPKTEIRYHLPAGQAGMSDVRWVTLTIYDLLGREVATLVNERLMPGIYTRQWNATGQPSGVYFYSLQTKTYFETKKLVILK